MAIEIRFEGIGTDLLESVKAMTDGTVKLRSAVDQTNEAIVKGTAPAVAEQQKFTDSVDASVSAVANLNKQSTAGGAQKLATDLGSAARASDQLDSSLTNTATQARAAAQASGPIASNLDQSRQRAVGLLNSVRSIPQAQRAIIAQAIQTANSVEQIDLVMKQLADDTKVAAEPVKSLRAQMVEARNTAAQMISKFGEFSPEAIAATKRAAELKDQIADLNTRLDSLNPDAKIGAFTRFGTVIASGAQALGGFFTAFGVGQGPIQEAALKLQSFVLGLQGAKEFLGGFKDAFKDVRVAILSMTSAQTASTVASEADIVAKEGQAVATTAVGTASEGAAVGIRAFTLAALSSPLAPFVLVLTAIGAAFAIISLNAEEATVDFERLNESLDDTIKRRDLLRAGRDRLAELEAEGRAIEHAGDLEAERNDIVEKGAREQASLEEALADRRQKLATEEADRQVLRAKLIKAANEQDFDAIVDLTKQLEEQDKAIESANDEIIKLNQDFSASKQSTDNDLAAFDAKNKQGATARAKKQADDEIRIRKALATELTNIQKQIADKIRALEIEDASPQRKLELQRQTAEEEVEILRQKLLQQRALEQIDEDIRRGRLKNLTEEQREAAASALISSGDFQLAQEDQEKFTAASLLIWKSYYDQVAALQAENDSIRADASGDNVQKQLADLDKILAERAQKLREAGVTEAEVEQDAARQTQAVQLKLAQDRLNTDEAIAIARVETIKATGDQTAEAQRAAELKILEIKLDFAQKELALIEDDGTKESQLRKAQAEQAVAELSGQLTKLQNDIPPVDIFDLLGFEFTEADKQRVTEGLNSVFALINSSLASQQAEVDAAISATDQIIADRERRTDSLRQQLDQEIELAKLGLANNVDAVRAQIDENQRALQADLENKRKLQAEAAKVARQQVLVDSLSQASSLATSVANLIKTWSNLPFGVGLISAFAQAAAIFSFFSGIRAKLKAAAQPEQIAREGGVMMLNGPRHEAGGLGVYDERTGRRIGEAEGDEAAIFFTRREQARKAMPYLEAINQGDIPLLADLAHRELMRSGAIEVNQQRRTEFIDQKHTYITSTTVVQKEENAALLKRIDKLTEEVKGFRDQQHRDNETGTTTGADGSIIESKPGVVRIRRKG